MEPISDRITVTNPTAVAAFAKARPRAILFALMETERSPRDLCRALGLSLSLLNYHLTRLQKLGLVRAVRQTRRAGRAITTYRAAARSFLVLGGPADASAGSSLRAELEAALERSRASADEGVLYRLDADGQRRMIRLGGPSANAAGEWWWRLSLSRRDAEALQGELRDLISGYRARTDASASEHLCHFAMART